MLKIILPFTILLLLIPTPSFSKDANLSSSSNYCSDSIVYKLEYISWVEVTFEGNLLREHKSYFEKLIRLRLRNDLSKIKHKYKNFNDLLDDYAKSLRLSDLLDLNEYYKKQSSELKKHAKVNCRIWTVGNDYPIAFHVMCNLKGMTTYGCGFCDDLNGSCLGITSLKRAKSDIEESVRDIITSICSDFFDCKDMIEKQRKSYDNQNK